MWCALLIATTYAGLARAALPLPNYIKPCARSDPNFNDCALQHAREAFPHIIKGDRKYNLLPLDPFRVEEIRIMDDCSKRSGLNMVFRNATVRGLSDTFVQKTQYDFVKQHIHHEVWVPRLHISGNYEVWGRVLLMPLSGKGDFSITKDNVTLTYDVDYTLQPVDGNRYLVPQNPRGSATPTRVTFSLTDLFRGNDALNNQLNQFLNQNWRQVMKELSPTTSLVFTDIVFKILSGLDKAVPFDVAFPENLPSLHSST